jgi:hypothetical protein
VSNGFVHSRNDMLMGQDAFRLRMENQCLQIKEYRRAMLRECGRLICLHTVDFPLSVKLEHIDNINGDPWHLNLKGKRNSVTTAARLTAQR